MSEPPKPGHLAHRRPDPAWNDLSGRVSNDLVRGLVQPKIAVLAPNVGITPTVHVTYLPADAELSAEFRDRRR